MDYANIAHLFNALYDIALLRKNIIIMFFYLYQCGFSYALPVEVEDFCTLRVKIATNVIYSKVYNHSTIECGAAHPRRYLCGCR